ncbi:MAG: helix-turn-helix domain-containing protein [Burkholderiaceae bacterium]
MRKGEQTRAAILQTALELASQFGLEGLTIGRLADRVQMSKSGVFAHFGSREELQIAVLREYEQRFAREVLVPALPLDRGLPRLRGMVRNWLERTALEADSGCLYIACATEYDDRPGEVRDVLVAMIRAWQRELTRAIMQAAETGELADSIDAEELVFQLYGIVLVLHHDARLLRSEGAIDRAQRAFERLLASYRAADRPRS